MSDKDELITNIKGLAKSREDKTARLKAAIKTVSENRRIARGQSSRPA